MSTKDLITRTTSGVTLRLLGLPAINSIEDFSMMTRISQGTLFQLSKNAEWHYKEYEIAKKSGGYRVIAQPSKKLKAVQSWILHNVLYKLNVSDSCKGFRENTSTLQNAEPHKDSNVILTIDLKDFFPSISSAQVCNIFKSIGYTPKVSKILTNICTYKNYLPQGSPCSPMLANLTCWTMDVRIQGYVGRRGINFTRYADDMTFSGLNPQRVLSVLPFIKEIIKCEGHTINNKKTRVAGPSRKKEVTGLIISNGSIGVGTEIYKKIRAKVHHLIKPENYDNQKLLNEVRGWLSYLNGVDKKRYRQIVDYATKLQIKYPKSAVYKLTFLHTSSTKEGSKPIVNTAKFVKS